jgi:nitrile hydratase accessory protein
VSKKLGTAVTPTAVNAMSGAAALPRRNGELVFEAPWQGRVFAMALAVVERLGLDWGEFQRRLIVEIDAHPEAPYYESWLAALERLALDYGFVVRTKARFGSSTLS